MSIARRDEINLFKNSIKTQLKRETHYPLLSPGNKDPIHGFRQVIKRSLHSIIWERKKGCHELSHLKPKKNNELATDKIDSLCGLVVCVAFLKRVHIVLAGWRG